MKTRKGRVWQIRIFLTLLFALFAIIVMRIEQETPAAAPTLPTEQFEIHSPVPETMQSWGNVVAAAPLLSDDPERPADTDEPELISDRVISDATPILLDSVPLSKETQWKIYDLCEQDNSLFCAVMAIANKESRFTPTAIGDNGRCIGMMQINHCYHVDRMEALGVTDLFDAVENAAVGISYIKDLEREFNVGADSHVLYMAYNMGPSGARNLFSQGIYSSSYSWAVAGYYDAYMQELSTGG